MSDYRTLDNFQKYNFNYYQPCKKLESQFTIMYDKLKKTGHTIAEPWPLDGGILLESNNVIAGAFFNLTKYKTALLINLIYVNKSFRRNGIYKKMHYLLDQIGHENNKSSIYSYIHVENKLMQDVMIEKIGYNPVMTLVKKEI